jgi:hypothetical protein
MEGKIVMQTGSVKDAPPKLMTRYWYKTELVKTTRGSNLFEASVNVVRNLQINKYKATYAEVLDADTEQLYYSQSRSVATGKLSAPHYEWDPASTVIKFSVGVVLL